MSRKAFKPKPFKLKTPESGTLAACLQLLAMYGIWHERRNTLPVLVDNGRGGKRPIKVAEPGTADIFATPECLVTFAKNSKTTVYRSLTHPGQIPPMIPDQFQFYDVSMQVPLWIECKSDSGRQRPAQKDFQQAVEAAGHSYLLVRDVNELVAWLKQRGVI